MELFDNFFDFPGGLHFLSRYSHILFGITWIGLLYFFNFVQVPSFAEMEAQARSEALRKITFRALWWFRWAAALTFLSGLLMWALANDDYAPDTSPGLSITFGSILGITMAANVWMVIWPNQRINIASAEAVAAGGAADPAAAGAVAIDLGARHQRACELGEHERVQHVTGRVQRCDPQTMICVDAQLHIAGR